MTIKTWFESKFRQMSIRQKISAGYRITIGLLVLTALVTILNIFSTKHKVDQMVDETQPLVLSSMNLQTMLHEANAVLGFYLLTKEDIHKSRYIELVDKLSKNISTIETYAHNIDDDELTAIAAEINQKVLAYAAYEEKMLALADDRVRNFPGVAFAATSIEPLNRELLQLLNSMILAEQGESTSKKRQQLLAILNDLRFAWTNIMTGIRGYIALREENSLDRTKLYEQQADELIGKINKMSNVLTFEQTDFFEQFVEKKNQFKSAYNELYSIHSSDRWRTDAYLIRTEFGDLTAEINTKLSQLVERAHQSSQNAGTSLSSQVSVSLVIVVGLLILGIFVGVTASRVFGNQTIAPINTLRRIIKDISQGQGDLTSRCVLISNDELGETSGYFNNMMDGLQGMVKEVASASEQVKDASLDVREIITAMATRLDDALNVTLRASEDTTEGATTIREMSTNAKHMTAQLDHLTKDINRSNDLSKNLLSLVQMVGDIAYKTNILALNASIEAARAGESGRGFSVVADEVRKLAERSQQSASKMSETINESIGASDQLVKKINEVITFVSSLNEEIVSSSEMVGGITHHVEKIRELIHDIGRLAGIDNATQTDSNALKKVNELSDLANQLENQVARFKIA